MGEEYVDEPADGGREYLTPGAEVYGAVVAETFLNRAKGDLEGLRQRLTGAVEHLEQYISSLEITVEGLTPVT